MRPSRAGGLLSALMLANGPALASDAEPAAGNRLGTSQKAQLLVGGGYGWGEFEGVNAWGPGFFLDLGYTTRTAVYLGVGVDTHFGAGDSGDSERVPGHAGFRAEAGYDVALSSPWLARAKLGGGFAWLTSEHCVLLTSPTPRESCTTHNEYPFAIGLGVGMHYLAGVWSFALEVRETLWFLQDSLGNGTTFLVGIGHRRIL